MPRLAEAIVLTAALLIACGGVGGAILRWAQLDEPGENSPARPLSFGVSAALGLALLVALGGLGVVLRIPVAPTVVAFSVIGIALQVVHVARARPHWTAIWALVLGVEVVALGLILLTQAGVGIAFHPSCRRPTSDSSGRMRWASPRRSFRSGSSGFSSPPPCGAR